MTRILAVNLNLDPVQLDGCRAIAAALATLQASAEVTVLHHAAVRRGEVELSDWDGFVLGPQGTPFSAYDAGFLPWVQAFVLAAGRPVLGVCGGMQALALAWGGRLDSAFGEPVGADYGQNRKIRGPLPVRLWHERLPAWLPHEAVQHLRGWERAGGRVFESHVEQVVDLPPPFVALASSGPTPVEAFAHPDLPILASQFHPELGWTEGCAAGREWLAAWLEVVRVGARQGRSAG